MPLNPEQEDALPVLDWLFSEDDRDRRTGRSWIIAVALIRQAARNPGQFIQARDHVPTGQAAQYVHFVIETLINEDDLLRAHREIQATRFRLMLPEPIQNWRPVGSHLTQAEVSRSLGVSPTSRYEKLLSSTEDPIEELPDL